MTNISFESSKSSHVGRDTGNNSITMIQIIAQEEIERWNFMAIHEEMLPREERLLNEYMMIRRHQQMEKEALILGSPHHLRV